MRSTGGQKAINGVMRLGECSGATEGHSARLGGVRGSIPVKVIPEMSCKRPAVRYQRWAVRDQQDLARSSQAGGERQFRKREQCPQLGWEIEHARKNQTTVVRMWSHVARDLGWSFTTICSGTSYLNVSFERAENLSVSVTITLPVSGKRQCWTNICQKHTWMYGWQVYTK